DFDKEGSANRIKPEEWACCFCPDDAANSRRKGNAESRLRPRSPGAAELFRATKPAYACLRSATSRRAGGIHQETRIMRDGRSLDPTPWSFFLPIALSVLLGALVAGLILRAIYT